MVQNLGLSDWTPDLHRCDILLRVTWPLPGSLELLITGEVSTRINHHRQTKVERQYKALTQAGHTVLPVLFGLQYRISVSLPNLLDVHFTEDELEDPSLLTPSTDLYTYLDRLLTWPDTVIAPADGR